MPAALERIATWRKCGTAFNPVSALTMPSRPVATSLLWYTAYRVRDGRNATFNRLERGVVIAQTGGEDMAWRSPRDPTARVACHGKARPSSPSSARAPLFRSLAQRHHINTSGLHLTFSLCDNGSCKRPKKPIVLSVTTRLRVGQPILYLLPRLERSQVVLKLNLQVVK